PVAAAAPAPYSLSLHDALPIWRRVDAARDLLAEHVEPVVARVDHHRLGVAAAVLVDESERGGPDGLVGQVLGLRQPVDADAGPRSEEHTSELQSRFDLVCRLLL